LLLDSAMRVKYLYFMCFLVGLFFSISQHSLAKVGDTYYCEKNGGRHFFRDGFSIDSLARLKNEGRPTAFIARHKESVLEISSIEHPRKLDIFTDHKGTSISASDKTGLSHFVIWSQGNGKFSFNFTRSSADETITEVGFCELFLN
jgi:hypothetical protein